MMIIDIKFMIKYPYLNYVYFCGCISFNFGIKLSAILTKNTNFT